MKITFTIEVPPDAAGCAGQCGAEACEHESSVSREDALRDTIAELRERIAEQETAARDLSERAADAECERAQVEVRLAEMTERAEKAEGRLGKLVHRLRGVKHDEPMEEATFEWAYEHARWLVVQWSELTGRVESLEATNTNLQAQLDALCAPVREEPTQPLFTVAAEVRTVEAGGNGKVGAA